MTGHTTTFSIRFDTADATGGTVSDISEKLQHLSSEGMAENTGRTIGIVLLMIGVAVLAFGLLFYAYKHAYKETSAVKKIIIGLTTAAAVICTLVGVAFLFSNTALAFTTVESGNVKCLIDVESGQVKITDGWMKNNGTVPLEIQTIEVKSDNKNAAQILENATMTIRAFGDILFEGSPSGTERSVSCKSRLLPDATEPITFSFEGLAIEDLRSLLVSESEMTVTVLFVEVENAAES